MLDKCESDCLVYCPWPYNGRGPAQTCVSILENMPADFRARLFLPRSFRAVSPSVATTETLRWPLRKLPWRLVSKAGQASLNRRFSAAINAAEPKQSIAYFWPDPPLSLVEQARARGLLTVREMINTFRGTAKSILDAAYAAQGLMPAHGITEESVERERRELATYDYVFAPNTNVEASLIEAGVAADRIVPASFGWTPSRFASAAPLAKDRLVALFVGSGGVRKGVPQLLEAWSKSGIAGELVLAGKIESTLTPLVKRYSSSSIRYLDFVADLGSLYRTADLFVFPTLEEGGPQVTYEAAGCGLPIITTPMGAARIIQHDRNGIIVDPNDVTALADAMKRMASSPELRTRLGRQAAIDAQQYTYEKIGADRAHVLKRLLDRHQAKKNLG
jgi:glycosyltransferase involved in cell wall biosynthesis